MDLDRDRLARAVTDAIATRYDTKAAFLRASGLAFKSLTAVLDAKPVAPETLRKVERGLGWRRFTADAILRGEDPATLPADEDEPEPVRSVGPIGRIKEMVIRVRTAEQERIVQGLQQAFDAGAAEAAEAVAERDADSDTPERRHSAG